MNSTTVGVSPKEYYALLEIIDKAEMLAQLVLTTDGSHAEDEVLRQDARKVLEMIDETL